MGVSKIRVPYFGVLKIRLLLFRVTTLGSPIFGNSHMILVKTQDTEDGAGNDPTRQSTTDRIQRLGRMKQQDADN